MASAAATSLRGFSIAVGFLACMPALMGASCLGEERAINRSMLNANGRASAQRGVTHEYRRPAPTHEDFVRWAHNLAPARMSSAQLDPASGLLAWPRALLRNEYADLRRPLDRMFTERANVGGAAGNELQSDILENIEQMTSRLTAKIWYMKGVNGTRDYIEARKFLESLEYEMGFAPGTADEVSRN